MVDVGTTYSPTQFPITNSATRDSQFVGKVYLSIKSEDVYAQMAHTIP